MDVDLEIHLEEREPDRVLVSLWIAPLGVDAQVDGATLALVGPRGEEVAPRTLLPIAGRLAGALALSVELRAEAGLPDGAQVVATAWAGAAQVQVSVPADPYVALRDYMRGARWGLPDPDDVFLGVMEDDALATLEAKMPWVGLPTRPPQPVPVLEAHEEASAEELADELGLGAEDAAWLKDLLDEPDL